ncbi:MAG: MFS transporter [Actinobacteria bacterium]|nr:MFS transporter [Actinomycetota bacterium]
MKVETKLYKDRNLQIIFSVTLIAIMGVSSITPAFPKIGKQLAISPGQVGLLITVFTLPGIFLTPVLGILADRLGRKKILVPSLMLFAAAGLGCAFAKSLDVLLAFRFIQGMGAASLGSINVTIVGDLYSGKQRAAAMGYNASVLSVGTASFPIVGGALAMIDWNYPFLLPLLAFPVGLVALFFLNNPEPKNNQTLNDYFRDTWQSLKNMRMIGLFLISILVFIILYGSYLTYFPFLVGQTFSQPPFVIGIIMASMSFTTAIASSQLGRLAKRFSASSLLGAASGFYALALVIVPHVHRVWLLLIPTVIFGMGHGILIPSLQTMLAELAPMNQRAAIMSINGMVLRIGQTLGPIFMGMFFAVFSISGVFYAGAGAAILILFLVMTTLR